MLRRAVLAALLVLAAVIRLAHAADDIESAILAWDRPALLRLFHARAAGADRPPSADDATKFERAIAARDAATVRSVLGGFAPAKEPDAVAVALETWDVPALARAYHRAMSTLPRPMGADEPLGPRDFERMVADHDVDDLRDLFGALDVLRPPKAQDADGQAATLFDRLAARGFSLRQASEGPKKSDAALFSYQHDEVKDDDVFKALMYLRYSPRTCVLSDCVALSPFASLELNLSGDPEEQVKNATGAFRLRAGTEGWWLIGNGPASDECSAPCLRALSFSANAKFDSSQDSETQKLSLELAATPVDSRVGAGVVVPPWPNRSVSFLWTPTVFVDAGTTIEDKESLERGSEVFRVGTTVRASFHFDDLMRRARLDSAGIEYGKGEVPAFLPYVFGEWTGRWAFGDEKQLFEYLKAGVHVPLSRNIGVDVLYEQGDLAPKFEYVERFSVGISVKF